MKGICRSRAGFALVITVALLALLVLAVFALSSLVRVGTQAVGSSAYQTQARQNALLALSVALGELQRTAGPDARVTGMAGITNISAGGTKTTRHWCGVWRPDGSFLGWLASGAQSTTAALQAGIPSVLLVGTNSVGASQSNSEHVVAGKLSTGANGYIAYWVGDEGVKITLAPILARVPSGNSPLRITSLANKSAADTMRAYIALYPATAAKMFSFEQAILFAQETIPGGYSKLTAGDVNDNFHHVTLRAEFLVPLGTGVVQQSGLVNVNTNSQIVWRGVVDSYNDNHPDQKISKVSTGNSSTAHQIANSLTSGPWLTVDAFFGSAAVSAALTGSGVSPAQFQTAMRPLFSARSDTFRIRAYGEALNPVDQSSEAIALCEAIVQRSADAAPAGLGRKFVITYFRWLGPDDI